MTIEPTVDERVRQLQKVLFIDSLVIEEGDDPDDPEQIGVIVRPSQSELTTAQQDFCGFTDEPSEYVLVAWSWSDDPDRVIDRRWEFIGDLQPEPGVLGRR